MASLLRSEGCELRPVVWDEQLNSKAREKVRADGGVRCRCLKFIVITARHLGVQLGGEISYSSASLLVSLFNSPLI